MEEYLINYLKVSTNDCLVKKYVDLFKVELDWFIYNYGEHVSSSYKRDCKLSLKSRLYRQLQIINTLLNKPINSKVHSNVLSSVYFADSQLLLSLGYNPISSIFQPVGLKNIERLLNFLVIREMLFQREFSESCIIPNFIRI